MFKAILPSKRLASADFTMVTNLDPAVNGKENSNPGAPGQKTTRAGLTMTKGFTQVYDKRRRTTKDDHAEIASSINQEQAFNQLLVCSSSALSPISPTLIIPRMIYKYLPLCVQNWLPWTLLSRQLC